MTFYDDLVRRGQDEAAPLVQVDAGQDRAVVTLNDPGKLNVLSAPLVQQLKTALMQLSARPTIRAVVITGAGSGFSAGGDLRMMAEAPAALPLRDDSVAAAMAILTLHHWDNEREAGVRELRRVASGPVVILTYVAEVSNQMWLVKDYLPEVGELDARIFPATDQLAEWLGGTVRVETLPVHRHSPDWMFGSFWAHPERVLSRDARNATSGFARMPETTVNRTVAALERDLGSGEWDRRHGHLRELDELDVGLRLVVGTPG